MIIDLNHDVIEKLSKTELEVVNFINDNENKLSELSIVDIAFETFSSPSTVSRAIRKCGINGFNELRYKLTQTVANEEVKDLNEIMNKSLVEATAVIEHMSMINVLNILHTMRDAKRILIFSRGPTQLVAKEFWIKLQVLGLFVVETDDPAIMRTMTKTLKPDDVVIILSLNGKTEELVESARNAKARGSKVISLCCANSSKLFEYSTYTWVGYKHSHRAIREYDVASRIPLNIMCRIIVDFLVDSKSK